MRRELRPIFRCAGSDGLPRPSECRRHYCGPQSISALTGVTVEEIEEAIAKRRGVGPRAVKGTYSWELGAVIQPNFNFVRLYPDTTGDLQTPMTFWAWLESRTFEHRAFSRFLVGVTGHFLAVSGGEVYCSARGLSRDGETGHKKARVKGVWRISSRTEIG